MKRTAANVINWLVKDLDITAPVRFAGWEQTQPETPVTQTGGLTRRWDVNCNVSYEIWVRREGRTPDEILQTLAHELRHVWQYENGKIDDRYGFWCGVDYRDQVEFHAELPEEIDADAYADTAVCRLNAVFSA